MISIKDLGTIITKSLPKNDFNIKAEIRQPKIKGGHLYLSLKDKDCEMNSIVWKNSNVDKNVIDGDMVEITGKLSYYSPRGTINMIISDMKTCNDTGDMYKQFEMLKNEFDKKGYFLNKKTLKPFLLNILILSSSSGAAIHDFVYTLDTNKCRITRTLIDVKVQGDDCPNSISKALKSVSNYDLIVITRGGGSMEDLWGFNHRDIIEAVHACTIPILSAVGHMVDTTLIDFVADISCPTPSLAGQYIVEHNMKYLANLDKQLQTYNSYLYTIINKSIERLNKINEDVITNKYKIINSLDNKLNILNVYLIKIINDKLKYLEMIENNNDKIILFRKDVLKKNTFQKNMELTFTDFSEIINKHKPFSMMWNGIKINITTYDVE